jgi:hypothetical protein
MLQDGADVDRLMIAYIVPGRTSETLSVAVTISHIYEAVSVV